MVPNPCSPDAINKGCTYPVIDNAHGKGILNAGEKFGWWIAEDCPLHGQKQKGQKDD